MQADYRPPESNIETEAGILQGKRARCLRMVAAVATLGGLFGMAQSVWATIQVPEFVVFSGPITAFYAGCAISGAFIWAGSERAQLAYRLLLIPQLVAISTTSFQYELWVGAKLTLGFVAGDLSSDELNCVIDPVAGTGFVIFLEGIEGFGLGLNTFAAGLLCYLSAIAGDPLTPTAPDPPRDDPQ